MVSLPLTKLIPATENISFQRGGLLIESLIGLLLFAIAAMGVSHMTAKTAVAQRESKVQDQVINELRSMVMNRKSANELCSGATLLTTTMSDSIAKVSEVLVSGCDLTTALVIVPANGLATETVTTIVDVHSPVILSAKIGDDGEQVRVGGTL